MPRGDRTGPNGLGARTGRGAGYCNGGQEPGAISAPGGGRGRRGGGGRRGWRNMFRATGLTGWQRAADQTSAPEPPASEEPAEPLNEELSNLATQAQQAAATLEAIRRRIEEIAAEQGGVPSAEA